MPRAAGDVGRGPERVDHGLLRGVDGGGEEPVQRGRRRTRRRARRRGRPGPSSRRRGRSRPLPWWATEPVRARPSPARRASRCSWAPCSGASVATTAMQLPASRDRAAPGPAQEPADGHAVDPQVGRRAEVREHEDADGRPRLGHDAARGADPALPVEADHPGARADRALGDRAAGRRGERAPGVRRLDLDRRRGVEPAVVALADDRDDDVLEPDAGIVGDRLRDRAVVDPPDRHRRRQVDRRLDRPPLRQRDVAGQLARAVEHRAAGGHRRCGTGPVPGAIAVTPVRRDLRLVAPDRDVADARRPGRR